MAYLTPSQTSSETRRDLVRFGALWEPVAVRKKCTHVQFGVVLLSIFVRDVFVRVRDIIMCAGRVCAATGSALFRDTGAEY